MNDELLDTLIVSGILVNMIVVYFLPTILARNNKRSTFILNLLFGWTIIGWIMLMIRSCNNPT